MDIQTNPSAFATPALGTDTDTASTSAISSDFETFLKMLTAQMENQDPLNPLDSQDFATQLATFSGVELKGRIELFERADHHVHMSVMGDLVDAELDRGGNLPRISPLRFGAGIHYHGSRWNAGTEVLWVDDQDDVAANESPTDGYTFLNANLGYRLTFGNQVLDLLLRGKNLTDEEARSHTSFLKNVAPLPGRDVTLSAKLRF